MDAPTISEELDIEDIETMAQLRLFRRQHPELPEALKITMFAVSGRPNIQGNDRLKHACEETLGWRLSDNLRFYVKEAEQYKRKTSTVPVRYTQAMLRVACLRKVRI